MRGILCKRCSHQWQTESTKHRICCPRCKTSITSKSVIVTPERDLTVYFPINILDKLQWTRALSWAKSNQEPFIKMNCDKEDNILRLSSK
jgi:DNA-directed RNA polymerase subunit RPC12/RpoP